MERVAGIEPARLAWKARALPLHHTRVLECGGKSSSRFRQG